MATSSAYLHVLVSVLSDTAAPFGLFDEGPDRSNCSLNAHDKAQLAAHTRSVLENSIVRKLHDVEHA